MSSHRVILSARKTNEFNRLVSEHIRNRDGTMLCSRDRPRFSEYELALQFKAQMINVARVPRGRRNKKHHAMLRALATTKPPAGPGRRPAPKRKDRDFIALEDLCPPVESLNSLRTKLNGPKVCWHSPPMDLSEDTFAHLLHRDELDLAARLRLDCATYLTSKRRIFISRRDCARNCKAFRKTDAQKACRIDVNKASKLWTAFDTVGWLELRWMSRFL